MRHSATIVLGGFTWDVRIIGTLAIIEKPAKFPPELPVPWEENDTVQLCLREPPPMPLYGFAVARWRRRVVSDAERDVRRYIREDILSHWKRKVAKEKKRSSRSRAPQRCRRHRNFRALR